MERLRERERERKHTCSYSSPVSIQTQSLALRALRKRKPQETQALALVSSQSWLPLCFDRTFLLAGACVCCVKISPTGSKAIGKGDEHPAYTLHSEYYTASLPFQRAPPYLVDKIVSVHVKEFHATPSSLGRSRESCGAAMQNNKIRKAKCFLRLLRLLGTHYRRPFATFLFQ